MERDGARRRDMVRAAMSTDLPAPGDAAAHSGPVYGYKPNLMGAPWVFALTDAGIEWEYGRRTGLLPYDKVRRVRMSFRPATLQTQRFMTEIWGEDSPKLQISSTTFRGLVEQARQDADYVPFVAELHRRLAAAGSTASFEVGMNRWLYGVGVVVMGAIAVVLAILIGRTALNRDLPGFAIVAAVGALFAWQAGSLFYRNRPMTYWPDAPPSVAMPTV